METHDGPRLVAELIDVPDLGSRIASAVAAMTREEPVDPDYYSAWAPASRVEAALTTTAIVVDLSPDAFAEDVDGVPAERSVQQLVRTAEAAAVADDPLSPQLPVRVTVDGGPFVAWGWSRSESR